MEFKNIDELLAILDWQFPIEVTRVQPVKTTVIEYKPWKEQ